MDVNSFQGDVDQIYVSGLPSNVTESEVAQFFGTIGMIKIDKKKKAPKIWLYRDKATGMLKGDATVTFEDPFAAASAPSWFNGKTWSDGVSVLHVSLAEAKQDAGYGAAPPQAAPQGPPGKFAPGDWTCTGCGNVNWERRKACNQCNTPKPGTVDTNREGAGGGFKERDDAEAEEARRRRREREQNEDYDEFGRPRKSQSAADREAREKAALERLQSRYVPEGGGRERSRSPARR